MTNRWTVVRRTADARFDRRAGDGLGGPSRTAAPWIPFRAHSWSAASSVPVPWRPRSQPASSCRRPKGLPRRRRPRLAPRGGGRRRAAAVPCCACARPCSLARRSWVARWAVSLARRSCSCSPAASPEGSPGLRGTAPSWGRPWSCVCSASVPTCPPARKGGRSPCLPRGSAWTRGCWCDGGCSPAVVKDSTEVRTRTGITFHGAGRRRHRARTHGGKSATYRKWEHLGRGNRSSRSEPHRDAPAWQRLHPSRLANPRDQPRGRPS